ncbi:hypothetical protein Tco_1280078 [Tanacetum coccineum]
MRCDFGGVTEVVVVVRIRECNVLVGGFEDKNVYGEVSVVGTMSSRDGSECVYGEVTRCFWVTVIGEVSVVGTVGDGDGESGEFQHVAYFLPSVALSVTTFGRFVLSKLYLGTAGVWRMAAIDEAG